MKKIIAFVAALALSMTAVCAFADDPYTMVGLDGGSVEHNWESNTFFESREEATGITFLFKQFSDYDEWQQGQKEVLTSDDIQADVLFKAELNASQISSYYEDGLIIDLKPYLEEYAPNFTKLMQEHPEWEKAITLPDGSIPALPSINEVQNNNAMWINKAWLDRLNLEIPKTREALENVLRAFKNDDPNRNGKKDEIPLCFISMWDLKFLSHAFGFTMNDYGVCCDENGNVEYMVDKDSNRQLIEWLHQLWQEGLLWDEGFITPDNARIITDSKNTKTYGMFFASTPLAVIPADWLDDYVMLMPVECDGQQCYRELQSDVIPGAFAITPHCKNPEKLVSWVDYLYSAEGSQRAQAGEENVDFQWLSDGTWNWLAEMSDIAGTILPEHTISEGGNIPGYIAADFQMAYDDEQTHRAVESLTELKKISKVPYPQVYFTKEERARLKEIQGDLGYYAEQQMAWFVAGDTEINDETWSTFCTTLIEKGAGELTEILQNAVNRQYSKAE